MKKLLIIIVIIFFIIFLFGSNDDNRIVESVEKRGVFISYIELSKYLKEKDENLGTKEINLMISNLKKFDFNMILLQVRTFSDAIYPSSIFPWSKVISSEEGVDFQYDILKKFIEIAHKNDMELHAWINPFRIRSNDDISDLSKLNPAFSYLDTRVVEINNGVFYNPAKEETKKIIIEGIEEIVKNYDVDGILFDDYFYPNLEIDLEEYDLYKKNYPNTSLTDFRLMHINDLVKRSYDVCHKYNKLFGISPDGNIDNNYQKHFADVKKWGSDKGYVDYLMPQIYYGFYNGAKDFFTALKDWEELASDVKLIPALAFYKVGSIDQYAKGGKEEWILNDDIIMREVLLSRNLKNYYGFSLFRYDYLFNSNLETTTTINEIENIKKILK